MRTSRHGGIVSFVEIKTLDTQYLARFYSDVFGWEAEPDGPSDYRMLSQPSGEHIASISGLDGSGVGLPDQWLIWIQVDDIGEAVEAAVRRGGSVVNEIEDIGGDERIAVMQDPSGAVIGFLEAKH